MPRPARLDRLVESGEDCCREEGLLRCRSRLAAAGEAEEENRSGRKMRTALLGLDKAPASHKGSCTLA